MSNMPTKIEYVEEPACWAQWLTGAVCVDHRGKVLNTGDIGLFAVAFVDSAKAQGKVQRVSGEAGRFESPTKRKFVDEYGVATWYVQVLVVSDDDAEGGPAVPHADPPFGLLAGKGANWDQRAFRRVRELSDDQLHQAEAFQPDWWSEARWPIVLGYVEDELKARGATERLVKDLGECKSMLDLDRYAGKIANMDLQDFAQFMERPLPNGKRHSHAFEALLTRYRELVAERDADQAEAEVNGEPWTLAKPLGPPKLG